MNVSIVKKLEQLEKRFSVKNTPSLIMIEYEPGEGVYLVHEQYCRFDGKGNVIEGGNRRNRKINALEEYEIPPDYSATVIIDLSGAGGQITAVSIPELRKKAHIGKAPFVFVGIAPAEDEREVTAEIGLIEKG